jgi:hypothetical protein
LRRVLFPAADFQGRFVLAGALPGEFKRLSQLEGFAADGQAIAGSMTSSFVGLRKLKMLSLQNNKLTGWISDTIGPDHPDLFYLDVGGNEITGPMPDSITELISLEYLRLDNNQLTGSIHKDLGLIPGLSEFSVWANSLFVLHMMYLGTHH